MTRIARWRARPPRARAGGQWTLEEVDYMTARTDLWFNIAKPNPRAKLRLFCFPYAGGSAAAFSDWGPELGGNVEVVGVQPPGRGNRFLEPPISSLREMVDELTGSIMPLLGKPFMFFGHSNGALICFELARALTKNGMAGGLLHVVVSGNPAPQIRSFDTILHDLPDDRLMEELRQLRGTPEEILQNSELLELFMPVLRADFAIAETHRFVSHPPLACDLTLFGGRDDHHISRDDLLAWGEIFEGSVDLQTFPGGHFFINESKAYVLAALKQRITQLAASLGRSYAAVL